MLYDVKWPPKRHLATVARVTPWHRLVHGLCFTSLPHRPRCLHTRWAPVVALLCFVLYTSLQFIVFLVYLAQQALSAEENPTAMEHHRSCVFLLLCPRGKAIIICVLLLVSVWLWMLVLQIQLRCSSLRHQVALHRHTNAVQCHTNAVQCHINAMLATKLAEWRVFSWPTCGSTRRVFST